MSTTMLNNVSVTFIDETSCCTALETLAKKHGLPANHPLIAELQWLMKVDEVDNFPVYLVHRAAGQI